MKRLPLTLGTFGVVGLTAAIIFVETPAQSRVAAQAAPAAQAPAGQGAGGAGGRGPGAPPAPPQNLQVLPKDMTTPQVQALMGTVAGALGVQCNYCHVPPAAPPAPPAGAAPAPAAGAPPAGRGRGPAPLDFVSDTKPEKAKARLMIKMVNDLNAAVTTAVGKPAAEAARVECVTCHRGVAIPAQLGAVVNQVMLAKGDTAAIARYRELRTQYYGSQAYDFTEPVLVRLANQSLAANKTDDAAAYLKLNLEFYPKSATTYLGLAQVKAKKNDKAGAIKDAEQALSLDPMNQAIQRQLTQLKAPAAQ